MTLDFSVWVEREGDVIIEPYSKEDGATWILPTEGFSSKYFEMEFLAAINVVPSHITPNVWA